MKRRSQISGIINLYLQTGFNSGSKRDKNKITIGHWRIENERLSKYGLRRRQAITMNKERTRTAITVLHCNRKS